MPTEVQIYKDKTIVPADLSTGGPSWDSAGNVSINVEGGKFKGPLEGNVTGDASGSSGTCSGNAATATKLATSRTIGGVSFDGSANIDLAGVNKKGNQDTSGNADTATKLATSRTIGGVSFDGSVNIDLAGVNKKGNQDTSGNADTATKLATSRTIGGVSFDGSVNIDLAGVNKKGNQDTSGNADTATSAGLATNVVGAANCILYNNSKDTTTSSDQLTFNGTTLILSCGGDIIAFASDERLKTNIEPIENAVDKVLKLRGFTYNFNEIGEGLGFDTSLRHAGVSAQEVQVVLPEAVCPAPANDEYLTVKYDKLVPLLIEAIKELKEEIKELKGGK